MKVEVEIAKLRQELFLLRSRIEVLEPKAQKCPTEKQKRHEYSPDCYWCRRYDTPAMNVDPWGHKTHEG